jgi:CDP-diacylglycerol--glycerol-3-phosphate 3-phosphatidyltransferase
MLGSLFVGAACIFAWADPLLLLLWPAWLLVRMALNAIDGMLAREHNMQTGLGGVLNEVGDVVSDTALYLPIAVFTEGSLWPAVLFTLGASLTEFCGVLGRALGASRRYDGPMGKSDRALFVGVLATATFVFPGIYKAWPGFLWAAAALTVLTCVRRCRGALRELSAGPR